MGRMLMLHVYSAENLAALLRQFPDGTVENAVPGGPGEDHWLFRADPVIDRAAEGMVNPSNQRQIEDMVTLIVGTVLVSAAERVERIAETTTSMLLMAMIEKADPARSIIVGPAETVDKATRDREAFGRAADRIEDGLMGQHDLLERPMYGHSEARYPEPVQHLSIEHEDRRLVADMDRFEEHFRVYLNCDQNGRIAVGGPLSHQRARDFADGFARGYDTIGKLNIYDHQAVPYGGVPKVILPPGHPNRERYVDQAWVDQINQPKHQTCKHCGMGTATDPCPNCGYYRDGRNKADVSQFEDPKVPGNGPGSTKWKQAEEMDRNLGH